MKLNTVEDINASQLLSRVAIESAGVADELLKTYDDETLKTVLEVALGMIGRGSSYPEALAKLTGNLVQATGLDAAELSVSVVLTPEEADRWDEISAGFSP